MYGRNTNNIFSKNNTNNTSSTNIFSRNNTFTNNNSSYGNNNSSYGNNNSSYGNNNSYGSNNNSNFAGDLGSYRVKDYKSSAPPRVLEDINNKWKSTELNPQSISIRPETLHLSVVELRHEDYFLVRQQKMNRELEKNMEEIIKKGGFNPDLVNSNIVANMKEPETFRQGPVSIDVLKAQKNKTLFGSSNNSNNQYTSSNNNSSNNVFGSRNNTSNNIFSSNNNNNNNNNNSSNNNIFNSSNNNNRNIFGNSNNSSNNSSNPFNRNNNNNSSGNNIFSSNNNNNNNNGSSGNNIFGGNNNMNNSRNPFANNNNNMNNSSGGNIFANNNNNRGNSNIFSNNNNNNNNNNSSNNIFNSTNRNNNNIFGNNSSSNNNNNNIFNNNNNNNNNGNNIFSNNNNNNNRNLFNNNQNNNQNNNNIFSNQNQNQNQYQNQNGYHSSINEYLMLRLLQENSRMHKSLAEQTIVKKGYLSNLYYGSGNGQFMNNSGTFYNDNGYTYSNNLLMNGNSAYSGQNAPYLNGSSIHMNGGVGNYPQFNNNSFYKQPTQSSSYDQIPYTSPSPIHSKVQQMLDASSHPQHTKTTVIIQKEPSSKYEDVDQYVLPKVSISHSNRSSRLNNQQNGMGQESIMMTAQQSQTNNRNSLFLNTQSQYIGEEMQMRQISRSGQGNNQVQASNQSNTNMRTQNPVERNENIQSPKNIFSNLSQRPNEAPLARTTSLGDSETLKLPDGYIYRLKKVSENIVENLQITNQFGKILWPSKINISNIDFTKNFSIFENSVQCQIPQLMNEECFVTYFNVPSELAGLDEKEAELNLADYLKDSSFGNIELQMFSLDPPEYRIKIKSFNYGFQGLEQDADAQKKDSIPQHENQEP